MKSNHLNLFVLMGAGLVTACAATIPNELVTAREAYRRASAGPASQAAPAELHVAYVALDKAEKSFTDSGDAYTTRDLAYVAQRKAQIAEATASIASEQKDQARSKTEFGETQGKLVAQTKADLQTTQTALAASVRAAQDTAARLLASQAALAKLAAVKDEPRGMVITLSGSVLFASNRSELLPEAKTRLDQVSDVLLTTKERNLTVEGHTDSQGSDVYNMQLSQSRADSVRTYLIQRGYEADRIQAHGMGEANPVADNATAEGRANNRRVEIVIQREAQAKAN